MLLEGLGGSLPAKALAGSSVSVPQRRRRAPRLPARQVGALGEVLAQQAVVLSFVPRCQGLWGSRSRSARRCLSVAGRVEPVPCRGPRSASGARLGQGRDHRREGGAHRLGAVLAERCPVPHPRGWCPPQLARSPATDAGLPAVDELVVTVVDPGTGPEEAGLPAPGADGGLDGARARRCRRRGPGRPRRSCAAWPTRPPRPSPCAPGQHRGRWPRAAAPPRQARWPGRLLGGAAQLAHDPTSVVLDRDRAPRPHC